ncbi:MAG: 3-methyl-2-oxobutanoate hydroxymethyltransferase [Chloroflexi bacterium]|nr:3-methyl-2-oxobutanoate hydroxymethyltransferase [Chloroflexota bacterium]MCH9039034.1 3-methyl-2-oxobutanoate hydroxymethyltransferase [Chloroflexota bacterium]MCI0797013.1 3-methyl-2-oxobutanoate hydroxymethyltransferase [Chloroflexota bacterium]MCI0842066.1 3-methyl-2-oxobutanoate hydroxymethyltransferase [Chloroflexota bacterium]
MRVTIRELKSMKARGEKIAMITAYDYTSAMIVERAGIPIILVGDSLGHVVMGHDSTLPVTMEDMVHHIKAVVRGTEKVHVVGDMPFMSYQADAADAIRNAGRLLKEGGCQSVKLEGGRYIADTVRKIVGAGVPVMGHLGLTPQAVNQLGGYRIQGRTTKAAVELIDDAKALEDAGAYALVLEGVPMQLAQMITERLAIPTIGIGAGVHCDGQVQVFHDLLGLFDDFTPKHARKYANLSETIQDAVSRYVGDVRAETFPTDKESFNMSPEVVRELTGQHVETV